MKEYIYQREFDHGSIWSQTKICESLDVSDIRRFRFRTVVAKFLKKWRYDTSLKSSFRSILSFSQKKQVWSYSISSSRLSSSFWYVVSDQKSFHRLTEEVLQSIYVRTSSEIVKYLTNHDEKKCFHTNLSHCTMAHHEDRNFARQILEDILKIIGRMISFTTCEDVDFSNSFDHRGRNLLDNDNDPIKKSDVWFQKFHERLMITRSVQKHFQK